MWVYLEHACGGMHSRTMRACRVGPGGIMVAAQGGVWCRMAWVAEQERSGRVRAMRGPTHIPLDPMMGAGRAGLGIWKCILMNRYIIGVTVYYCM